MLVEECYVMVIMIISFPQRWEEIVTCVAIMTYVDICCVMMQLGMRNVTTCEMVVRNGMILITFILS